MSTQQLELGNITTLEFQSQQKLSQETTGQRSIKALERSRQGDAAELIATVEAWKRGAEVFRNVGCTGSIDLVLKHPNGSLLAVDVKSMCSNGAGHIGASANISKATEAVVLVHPYTEQVRWVRGKEPLGWEDFWN